jgi:altronate hydrolase
MGPEHGAFERDYDFCAGLQPTDFVPAAERATFEGFRRSNGKAGTRNYLGILTSVNCSATVAKFMAQEITRSGILDDYPTIDGVVPFVHGTGCAMDLKGEGFDVLRRTQWGYTSSPNLGGALLVGLGCEAFQIGRMKEAYGIDDGDTFQTMTIQEIGGTRKMIAWGVERIKEMLPIVARARRETIPASEITLALQCGGSDGYSGITANPALGKAADLLVEQGGPAVLCETPEIYGAEHLLTRRAARLTGENQDVMDDAPHARADFDCLSPLVFREVRRYLDELIRDFTGGGDLVRLRHSEDSVRSSDGPTRRE